jgi:hypothetical protein
MKLIEEKLGWQNYGGKHYESIYTRFFQAYILPRKFNIDKRKAHLTCLMISTGNITREEALMKLQEPTANPKMLEDDKEYLLKKLDISSDEFEEIMNSPIKSILDYPNYHTIEMKFRRVLNKLRAKKILPN